jgi:hypothetical protein
VGGVSVLIVAAVLCLASEARAGITYVKDNTVVATMANQSSVTGTLTGVTAGNLVVAIVATDSNATITKPSSSWVDPGVRADSGANVGVAIYYYPNHPGGNVSAAFSFSVANGSGIVQLIELAGAMTSSPLDVTGTASGQGTSATVTSSAVTTAPGDIAIAGWANSTGNRTFGNPAAPWILVNNDVQSTTTDEEGTYQTDIAVGTTVSETLSVQRATTYWAVALVTFKAAPLYWRGGLSGCAGTFTSTTCWSRSSGGTSAGVAPGTTDIVTFDSGGTGNCALSSAATTQVKSISLASGYTGTVTQGSRGVTLSGDLSVAGGTFTGASGQSITTTGRIAVSGTGTFNGNGATVSVATLAISGGTYTQGSGTFTASGAATFSGGTSTFAGGTSAFQDILTTSGTSTRLTFGTGAPTVTDVATFNGGTITFGAGQLRLNNGLDVEGAAVTLGSSASTTTVTGTLTMGSGTLNLANGSAATDFTCTDVVTQSGGTINVNGATATLATGVTGSTTNAFIQSDGAFTNLTSGGSVTVGSSGGGGGIMTQTGSTAVYSSTASETFNGPLKVSGSMGVGSVTLAGNSNTRKLVTVNSGGALSLSSSGLSFSSTNTMTIAGTLNAGTGTATFAGAVTLSGTLNGSTGTQRFDDTVSVSGTFDGSTGTQAFADAVTITGTLKTGTASMTGTTTGSRLVTLSSGGTMTLASAGFTFNSTNTMTLAGTLNAAGAVRFNGAVTLSGTYNVQTSTTTFDLAVTMSGSSAFNGGTGSTTFTTAPTLTAGTFTVGSSGTAGVVTMSAGASFASGMTLVFPANAGRLAVGQSQALSVAGVIQAATTGATKPRIECSNCTTNQGFPMTFTSNATLNIDGLQFDHVNTSGVQIADMSAAKWVKFQNVTFTNNAAGNTASGTHLAITRSTSTMRVPGCYFDGTAKYNVTLSGVSGSTGVHFIFEDQGSTVSGPRAGELWDLDADTSLIEDNIADGTAASPRWGSVVEWAAASPTDTSGTAVGFPTAAFDWNNFSYYGIYAAYKNTGGGTTDVLWKRNNDGSAAYSFPLDDATFSDLIGTPKFDTINEKLIPSVDLATGATVYGLDINGDGDALDENVHVVYLATAGRPASSILPRIIKLIDTGSALVRPSSGKWASDFSSSTVKTISSPLIADTNNLYFGGTDSGNNTKIFGVQISNSSSAEQTLRKNVATAGAVSATPAWKLNKADNNTYLFLGTAATGLPLTASIYRMNVTTGLPADQQFTGSTTNINDSIRLINDRAWAVTEGGYVYCLNASDTTPGAFTNLSTFNPSAGVGRPYPLPTAGGSPMRAAPYVDPYTNAAYVGDNAGKIHIVTSTGTSLSPYPYTVPGTPQFTSSPVYMKGSGIIAIGGSDGYVYFINRHNSSNTPVIHKKFSVTSSGTVSTIGYNNSTAQYMVSSSDGKLLFIKASDVSDPDTTE